MSTASTLRILADAIEVLENPTPMPKASTIDMNLIDAMVLLAENGTLAATIEVSEADKAHKSKGTATIAKARKPKAVKNPVTVNAKGQNVKLNDYGTPMLSDAGTATKGQQDWAVKNRGITAKAAAKLSMVEASNARKAHNA